ncbi:MAG: M50 family metallopeptidase [Candidatus Saccharimonadaceae bacterium]
MELISGVILGLIVLTLLVVAHELGHAITARRNGVVVEEFGVGFPPKAWSKKIKKSWLGKDVEYSVNWLPLGGFVKLQGENDAASGKGDYGAATFWQKTKILLAGVMMNWLVAAVLFTVLALTGLPKILPNQFTVPGDTVVTKQPVELANVAKDSPAEQAGLKAGDQILSIAGSEVPSTEELSKLTAQNKGRNVPVVYSRAGSEQTLNVQLRDDPEKGYLGVNQVQREEIRATWSAPVIGVGTTVQLSYETVKGLGDLLYKSVSGAIMQFSGDKSASDQAKQNLNDARNSVAGPVGIFGTIFPAAEKAGPTHVVLVAAIISLSLAVMNILPIPALDGGRWFVTALYKIRKKELLKETEEKIHGTGFMVLIGLILLITVVDIGKLFG